jgi:hypothetical protein
MAEAVQWLSRITTIAVVMGAPAAAGAWLDRRFGTAWLSATGLVLGFTSGIWLILRLPGAVARRQRPDSMHGRERQRRRASVDWTSLCPVGSLWLVGAAGLAIAGLSIARGFGWLPALVAFAATVPGAVAGRIMSIRRPKAAATAIASGLGGAALRFTPALLALGWLAATATIGSAESDAGGWRADAAVWLVVTYLTVLAADIGLHIIGHRRHTGGPPKPGGKDEPSSPPH